MDDNFKDMIEQYSIFFKKGVLKFDRFDIGYGKCGIIIFHLYKFKIFKNNNDIEYCKDLLESILEDISTNERVINQLEIIELLYFLFFFKEDLNEFYELDGFITQLESSINSTMNNLIQSSNFDGYVGAGYILNYYLVKKDIIFLEDFINFLDINKQITEFGDFYVNLDSSYYKNVIQLGLTHGIAFVVNMLTKYYLLNPENKKIIYLVEGFVKFILRQKQNFNDYGCFFYDNVEENGFSRYNLAYGDLGILYSLLQYSIVFKNQDVKNEVLICIKISTRRKKNYETGIIDSSILYGASGILLFYSNLKKMHSELIIDKEILFWEDKTREFLLTQQNEKIITDCSFFEGILGAFVVLMSNQINDNKFSPLFYL